MYMSVYIGGDIILEKYLVNFIGVSLFDAVSSYRVVADPYHPVRVIFIDFNHVFDHLNTLLIIRYSKSIKPRFHHRLRGTLSLRTVRERRSVYMNKSNFFILNQV